MKIRGGRGTAHPNSLPAKLEDHNEKIIYRDFVYSTLMVTNSFSFGNKVIFVPMVFVALTINYINKTVINQFNSLGPIEIFLFLTSINSVILLGYASWLYLQNISSLRGNEDSTDQVLKYYMLFFFVIFAILVTFFSTLAVIYNSHLSAAIAFFNYFESSKQFLSPLVSQIPTFIGLPVFLAYIIGFFTFFNFIRRKGVMIYDVEGNVETKYIDSLISFFGFFNYLILIPLVIYLLVIKQQLFESIVLVGLLLLTELVFIPLFLKSAKLLQDYEALSICNPYYTNEDIKAGLFHNEVYSLRGAFGHTVSKKDDFLKAMMSLTLLIPLLGIGLNFNALSVVYIGLTFIVWYFIVSAVSLLPFKKMNLYLSDGQILKSVYIIEDSQKGHLMILTPENELMPIMKDSIIKTERSKY
ncbi:MAG: hypothetical protein NC238_07495 [Dehalobacter sp.]|nr:hypothetical protein [Dehalobacter sp.]